LKGGLSGVNLDQNSQKGAYAPFSIFKNLNF